MSEATSRYTPRVSHPLPGWYPDAQNNALVRWWDGLRWTHHVQPAPRNAHPLPGSPAVTIGQHAGAWPAVPLQAMQVMQAMPPMAPVAAVGQDPRAEYAQLQHDLPRLRAEHAELRAQVVDLRETAMLQEVGLYEYSHPLDSATAYKERLVSIQKRIKEAVKQGEAVKGAVTWSVNGSAQEGGRMVTDLSKLVLRAYCGNRTIVNARIGPS